MGRERGGVGTLVDGQDKCMFARSTSVGEAQEWCEVKRRGE